jgi:transcriptional regulator
MYTPKHFVLEDRAEIARFMARHSFALLIDAAGAMPVASHLPLLYEAERGRLGTLVGHMAKANPQWQRFKDGTEVLVVFWGPHAYVSPSWYASQPNVPTWNYITVHAYGRPRLLPDPAQAKAVLEKMVATYESGFAEPWRLDLPERYEAGMIQGIMAFEIELTRIEGKAKLSQNRKPEDQKAALAGLSAQPDPDSRATAQAMRDFGVGV